MAARRTLNFLWFHWLLLGCWWDAWWWGSWRRDPWCFMSFWVPWWLKDGCLRDRKGVSLSGLRCVMVGFLIDFTWRWGGSLDFKRFSFSLLFKDFSFPSFSLRTCRCCAGEATAPCFRSSFNSYSLKPSRMLSLTLSLMADFCFLPVRSECSSQLLIIILVSLHWKDWRKLIGTPNHSLHYLPSSFFHDFAINFHRFFLFTLEDSISFFLRLFIRPFLPLFRLLFSSLIVFPPS